MAQIEELTKIDRWFLEKLENIHNYSKVLSTYQKIEELPAEVLHEAKRLGFRLPDRTLRGRSGRQPRRRSDTLQQQTQAAVGVAGGCPNTVASDHPDKTNYLYFTYGPTRHTPPTARRVRR